MTRVYINLYRIYIIYASLQVVFPLTDNLHLGACFNRSRLGLTQGQLEGVKAGEKSDRQYS